MGYFITCGSELNSISTSHLFQLSALNELYELLFNSPWHRPASNQHPQFHIDRECLPSKVGRQKKQPFAKRWLIFRLCKIRLIYW